MQRQELQQQEAQTGMPERSKTDPLNLTLLRVGREPFQSQSDDTSEDDSSGDTRDGTSSDMSKGERARRKRAKRDAAKSADAAALRRQKAGLERDRARARSRSNASQFAPRR
jgi:hypothetical protein